MCLAFLDHNKSWSMPCRVYHHNRLETRQAGNCRQTKGAVCVHSLTTGINRAGEGTLTAPFCVMPNPLFTTGTCHTQIYAFPADLISALYSTHLRWAEQCVQLTFTDTFHGVCQLITILWDWKVSQSCYQRRKKKIIIWVKITEGNVCYYSTSAARRKKQNKRQI